MLVYVLDKGTISVHTKLLDFLLAGDSAVSFLRLSRCKIVVGISPVSAFNARLQAAVQR